MASSTKTSPPHFQRCWILVRVHLCFVPVHLVFFTKIVSRLIELKITYAPLVLSIVPEKKSEINLGNSSFPRSSSRLVTHTFLFKLLSNLIGTFPRLVMFLRHSINRRVSGLFSRLFMNSITFLFAPQW